MTVLPFDELNKLEESIGIHFEDGKIRSKQDCEDIIDEMLDLFLLAYANGQEQTNADLSSNVTSDLDDVMDTIDKKIEGKTWRDRVWQHFEEGGTQADIARIIETEAHRDSNEAAYKTATKAGAKTKTWHCMMLESSRDQHIFLDGVIAPIDGYFYTYTGAKAKFPGEFGEAENDCNCLCWVSYSK